MIGGSRYISCCGEQHSPESVVRKARAYRFLSACLEGCAVRGKHVTYGSRNKETQYLQFLLLQIENIIDFTSSFILTLYCVLAQVCPCISLLLYSDSPLITKYNVVYQRADYISERITQFTYKIYLYIIVHFLYLLI